MYQFKLIEFDTEAGSSIFNVKKNLHQFPVINAGILGHHPAIPL